MADKMVQYNILQRDADANKQLYDGLLQKLKEAGISAGLRSSNIRVVDPAFVPQVPSASAKVSQHLPGDSGRLVGGVGLALLREYLDNTVKNPDDIETLAHLPSLGRRARVCHAHRNDRNGRLPKLLKAASRSRA